jgi:hypothetical protein
MTAGYPKECGSQRLVVVREFFLQVVSKSYCARSRRREEADFPPANERRGSRYLGGCFFLDRGYGQSPSRSALKTPTASNNLAVLGTSGIAPCSNPLRLVFDTAAVRVRFLPDHITKLSLHFSRRLMYAMFSCPVARDRHGHRQKNGILI